MFFKEIVEKDELKDSQRNSNLFLESYKEFISEWHSERRKAIVREKAFEFSQTFNRNRTQTLIESDLENCTDENMAYDFLVAPGSYLNRYYARLMESTLKQISEELSGQVASNIHSMLDLVEYLHQYLTNGSLEIRFLNDTT